MENNIHFIKEEYLSRERNSLDDMFRDFTQTSIPADGMYDEKVTLHSKPLFINVKPLPAPDSINLFKGAVGNFNIKSYLSKDQILSADDYQDGIVPTANLPAATTTQAVAGAMTVSSAVAAGQYYLILKVDADNQIAETNENNNTNLTGFITVTGGTTGGGADLALSIVSTPSVFRKYSVNTMRVTAQNVGNQTLTNVKVTKEYIKDACYVSVDKAKINRE